MSVNNENSMKHADSQESDSAEILNIIDLVFQQEEEQGLIIRRELSALKNLLINAVEDIDNFIYYFDRMDRSVLDSFNVKVIGDLKKITDKKSELVLFGILSHNDPSVDGKHFKGNSSKDTWKVNKITEIILLIFSGVFKHDCLIKTKYYDSFLFDSINDDLTKIESRIMGVIKKKEVTNTLLFADFECFTSGEFHQPFCIIVMKENGAWKSFYGLHCAYNFIEYISTIDSPICYFHNLGYDGRFHGRFGIINIIMRGKMIYKMVVEYKGKKIIFKDTLSLIPTSIANFKQFFKLDGECEKEILPYNYYSEETMEIGIINECGNNEQPVWSEDTRKKFKDLLVKCNCLIDDTHFNSKNIVSIVAFVMFLCLEKAF
ncbi:hypothetical protein ENUP19_0351G0004 [Entamoeba nuttalli]|uniref:DNA-directed DNA polymerase n=1 Tax=Entamoeba nuttalli TaxID=412467 RepID=A0ABQ0DXV4_9EUKA